MKYLLLIFLLSSSLIASAQTTNTITVYAPDNSAATALQNTVLIESILRTGIPKLGENGYMALRHKLEMEAKASPTLLISTSPIIVQAEALRAQILALPQPQPK